LPVLEPRGAIRADLIAAGRRIRVVGMHLDLSGLRRRQQLRAILAHLARCDHHCPTVVMGDCNEWGVHRGALSEFRDPWRVLAPGRSFPARQPVARFDRIAISEEWGLTEAAVHHSALAAKASDHLPVWARLELPKI
jgi:endonuclease/exonuclease/phosphatase family metal-dependent hydrolase